jgi:hypothetical protein
VLKEFAWKAFENTGNIDSYIFLKEIENKNMAFSERKKAEEEAAISNMQ